VVVLGVVGLAYAYQQIRVYTLPTKSMVPTIEQGGWAIASKWSSVSPGDLAVFELPKNYEPADVQGIQTDQCMDMSDMGAARFLKRVVATGGESVSIEEGTLRVDGKAKTGETVRTEEGDNYLEPMLKIREETIGQETYRVRVSPAREAFGPVTVPDGHIFVMGDNRTASADSRCYGPIPREAVVGRVIWR
jgi:signal peptidase I